jgi:GrpB-like predicted nucleotidyltransferase (UPF0157 family)
MRELRFRPATELWPLVDRAFQQHSREVRRLVPGAEVEHMGATAVPGSLTKGDLDLLVRVAPENFPGAVESLTSRYAIHQPENWTATYASFFDERDDHLPVGVQLVVTGSDIDDAFVAIRQLLRAGPTWSSARTSSSGRSKAVTRTNTWPRNRCSSRTCSARSGRRASQPATPFPSPLAEQSRAGADDV